MAEYLTISEMSSECGLSMVTLRRYDDYIRPARGHGGVRMYKKSDKAKILKHHKLLKSKRFGRHLKK